MSGPVRVRKRPVEVEAMQLTKTTLGAAVRWLPAEQLSAAGEDNAGVFVAIRTLEGVMRASEGDWIVRGVRGEHHPVRGDIFDETYDVVGEGRRREPMDPRLILGAAPGLPCSVCAVAHARRVGLDELEHRECAAVLSGRAGEGAR